MGNSLATLVCALGILGLFFLDRDKSVRTSVALWIPVLWLLINGSRPVSVWLGISPMVPGQTDVGGSPIDRAVFSVLIAAGVIVLIGRSRKVMSLLLACWPICLYFLYCLVSVSWSDYPDVSFKRWIKSIGDLVMVLVVVTEIDPLAALKRILSRVGFILLPASVLLIRYFGDLGRSYDPWSGRPMDTGVTTNKNVLGLIAFTLALGALWQCVELLRAKEKPNRGRHLLAQSILLAFGIALLAMAGSATSLACFVLSAALLLVTRLSTFRRPAHVHLLVLAMIVVAALTMFLGGEASLLEALGRSETFTGRTDLWRRLLPLASNPFFGVGFESFWIGPRLQLLKGIFFFIPNEAHNGYIEVYLQLGWVGVGLIALIFVSGYRKAVAALSRGAEVGGLAFGFIVGALIYNVTEAGFRMLGPAWIFLLLLIASASVAVPAVMPLAATAPVPSSPSLTTAAAVSPWQKPRKRRELNISSK